MSRIAKLPAGFRQVEYIESSGEQYVDTGIKPKFDTRIVMDVSDVTNVDRFMFGAKTADGIVPNEYALLIKNATTVRSDYFGTYASATISSLATRTTLEQNGAVFKGWGQTINGTSVSSGEVPYPLYIFSLNIAGTSMYPLGMRLYSCQIYDNDTIIRDFIPCINASGAVGLYDTVNAQFYGNSGTGVFTAGPNVYKESEVTKLEYIESTGTQYVKTGVYHNANTCPYLRMVLDAELPVSSGVALNGVGSGQSFYIGVISGYIYYSTYYGDIKTSLAYTAAKRCEYDLNNTNAKFSVYSDGAAVLDVSTTLGTPSESREIYLFTYNTSEAGAVGAFASEKIYACQLYIANSLERDYYPAEVNGEIGLWDALSGILYTDAAGGTFIAGPKVISIAPQKNLAAVITEAGVVLTWDAEEKALGYKVYRDETNIAYTTGSSYTDGTAKPDNNYIYGVSAYNADTETKATEIMVFVESPYSPLELITDRTQKALDRVIELAGKDYMTEMSAEEQEEWRDGMKGAYNASDMNRVGKAVDALAKLLRELVPALKNYAAENQIGWDTFYAPPFDPSEIYPATKRDWTVRDIPTPADMELYLSNIKLLRSALVYNTDALPATMENLTWSGANAIEKALFALDGAIILFNADMRLMIDKAVATMFYCNEIYSGEV